MIEIRAERPGDEDAVWHVNIDAFGQTDEATLVDTLRRNCMDRLSLVAVAEQEIVGHILFTPAVIGEVQGMGLAPMAVTSKRQRDGIGSQLVRRGIERLRERGCPFIIVLGHPEYYPRFGFKRASSRGIRSQWERVPDEAFMVLVLDESAMSGVSGVARYRPELSLA